MEQKLINGDCMEVIREIPDRSISCVLTDPPYGIDYQSAWRIDTERFNKLEGDKGIDVGFIKEAFRILKEDGAFYLFTRWDVYPEWIKATKEVGFTIKNCIIWDRVVHGLGDLNGSYAPTYDMIIFAVKGKHILKDKRPKDVIRIKRVDADKLVHPTQKPIELIRHLIKNSTEEGECVFDGYAGSGTTAKACKELNRGYICVEIDKNYFDIMQKRLSQETLKLKTEVGIPPKPKVLGILPNFI